MMRLVFCILCEDYGDLEPVKLQRKEFRHSNCYGNFCSSSNFCSYAKVERRKISATKFQAPSFLSTAAVFHTRRCGIISDLSTSILE